MGICRIIVWSAPVIAFIAVLIHLYISNSNGDTGSYYKAGVVEYSPCLLNSTETPEQLVLRNANRYVQIINTAASHAVDILVLPECGLTSINLPIVRDKIFPYLTKLPELGAIPCDDTDTAEVLKQLSCAAREAHLYLVINIGEVAKCVPSDPGCPFDQSLFYNSNVVFDRNGKIIAKYRKFNLYIEPEFNITAKPELSVFETDFGVKFGTFICFDIAFKEPALKLLKEKGVTDIVYPTAWFSELPYITADSIQAGWSYSNNVNLLASGYNNPLNKNTGSGIYAGVNGTLVAVMAEDLKTQLLIAQVPIKSNPNFRTKEGIIIDAESSCTVPKSGIHFFQANLTGFETRIISSVDNRFVYKNGVYECDIKVNYIEPSDVSKIRYRFAAFHGERFYAVNLSKFIEVCGVMACSDESIGSCGLRPNFNKPNRPVFNEIEVTLKSSKDLFSSPITLNKDILPISTNDFIFEHISKDMKMTLKSRHDDLIYFGIFRGF